MPEGISLQDLNLRTTGRRKEPLVATMERPLTASDILALNESRETAAPQTIKKVRERHHALAKALVDGIGESEAAIICGYTPAYVSVLKSDRTFQELMKFYESGKQERYLELHEELANLGTDAVKEISDRLENAPEDLSIGQLIEVSKMALDRSGHGPSTTTDINVNVGLAEKLQQARDRAQAARISRMKDITPSE